MMSPTTSGAADPADKSGFLELRGFKHKLFVAVAGDKVFLYKNAEVGGWWGGGCGTTGDPDAISRGTPSLRIHSLSRAAVSWDTPELPPPNGDCSDPAGW